MTKLLIWIAFVLFPFLVHAESAGLKVNDIPANGDTSIVIKKGAPADMDKDFEIVSGTDEVAGDPEMGTKAAHNSWKAACESWKKDMKEMNKDNQLLALSCGSPSHVREDGQYTYRSAGSYKVKVRVRGKP